MHNSFPSQRVERILSAIEPFLRFYSQSTYARRAGDPTICDFVLGNPHEMPLAGYAEALGRSSVPQHKDWFAYKMSEPASRRTIVASLKKQRGVTFEEEDIFLTTGGFAGLTVTLNALTDPDDEVIFLTPPWFFYEGMIRAQNAVPVRVAVRIDNFDLDLEAIEAAITARTRAIILNSPNNPTGRVYPPQTLERLAAILTEASTKNGRPIYLLSDEAYSRIVYEGTSFTSPTTIYPHSFLIYTYGKSLLTPGQRIGFVAMPPGMPGREVMRDVLLAALVMNSYAFPNALLQHALPDLDQLLIDVDHLQRKRDRLIDVLREIGYEVHVPDGTFYLLPRSPLKDDLAFTDVLNRHNIFVLPGSVVELPGYFRLSLTANDEMIERSVSGFAAAWQEATAMRVPVTS